MLEALDQVPWASQPQPSWNRPDSVPAALRLLNSASTPVEAQTAYNQVLYAFGNNHAGTYYPVVIRAVPFLAELLSHNVAAVREVTLDVLIDLVGSFAPEPGFDLLDEQGPRRHLSTVLHAAVAELRPVLMGRPDREDATRENRLINDLLNLIAQPAR